MLLLSLSSLSSLLWCEQIYWQRGSLLQPQLRAEPAALQGGGGLQAEVAHAVLLRHAPHRGWRGAHVEVRHRAVHQEGRQCLLLRGAQLHEILWSQMMRDEVAGRWVEF